MKNTQKQAKMMKTKQKYENLHKKNQDDLTKIREINKNLHAAPQ